MGKLLKFLEDFISKYYSKQPPWSRAITWFAFVALFLYSGMTLIGGDHSVCGRVVIRSGRTLQAAKNFDVRLGDRFFGTNSKGVYYLILNTSDYCWLWVEGELRLGINKDDEIFPNQDVRFLRDEEAMADIELSTATGVTAMANRERQDGVSLWAPAAWAGGFSPKDRLFIQSIDVNSDDKDLKLGELHLVSAEESSQLRARQAGGAPAGAIPLASGAQFDFGSDYYFPIDKDAKGVSADLILRADGGMFSKHEESFKVPLSQPFGQPLNLVGNKGSHIRASFFTPYNAVLFSKADFSIQALSQRLLKEGFLPLERPSPLGSGAQTDALFVGKGVPYTALQKVLGIMRAERVPIKTIQYPVELKSGNAREIQIGSSARFNTRRPIPDSLLDRLGNATSEAQFKSILATIDSRRN